MPPFATAPPSPRRSSGTSHERVPMLRRSVLFRPCQASQGLLWSQTLPASRPAQNRRRRLWTSMAAIPTNNATPATAPPRSSTARGTNAKTRSIRRASTERCVADEHASRACAVPLRQLHGDSEPDRREQQVQRCKVPNLEANQVQSCEDDGALQQVAEPQKNVSVVTLPWYFASVGSGSIGPAEPCSTRSSRQRSR